MYEMIETNITYSVPYEVLGLLIDFLHSRFSSTIEKDMVKKHSLEDWYNDLDDEDKQKVIISKLIIEEEPLNQECVDNGSLKIPQSKSYYL